MVLVWLINLRVIKLRFDLILLGGELVVFDCWVGDWWWVGLVVLGLIFIGFFLWLDELEVFFCWLMIGGFVFGGGFLVWEIVIIIKLLLIILIIEIFLIKLERNWIIILLDMELGVMVLCVS